MLDVINLDFDYQDMPLLKNVAFHLPEGGLLHLRGANGAGKTTLLKVISGLHQPSQGQVQFFGQAIDINRSAYQRQLCFVGHKSGLNPFLSIRENCLFDMQFGRTKRTVTELAAIFKLEDHLDLPCGLLSAGQRRQVGLLRLWMSDAPLWLLDEPLVALDGAAVEVLSEHVDGHRRKGGAVLLTSHQNLPPGMADYQEYYL